MLCSNRTDNPFCCPHFNASSNWACCYCYFEGALEIFVRKGDLVKISGLYSIVYKTTITDVISPIWNTKKEVVMAHFKSAVDHRPQWEWDGLGIAQPMPDYIRIEQRPVEGWPISQPITIKEAHPVCTCKSLLYGCNCTYATSRKMERKKNGMFWWN